MMVLILAAAQITVTPAPPRSALELRSAAAGEALGACVAAASQRAAASDASAEAIVAAAFAACEAQERAARLAYAAYLSEIGISTSPEQIAAIFEEGRAQVRRRLVGCIAETRARREGRAPLPC